MKMKIKGLLNYFYFFDFKINWRFVNLIIKSIKYRKMFFIKKKVKGG